MISLRRSVAELDGAERTTFHRTLGRVLDASGQYAVELNPQDSASLRYNISVLRERSEQLRSPEEYDQLSADFRGELREYRDKAQTEASRMREELATTAEAMQSIITNITENGGDHEATLRKEFDALESAAESGSLEAIRDAIRHAAQTALQVCEDIRSSRDVIITQLQDEIRNLHQQVRQEQNAALTDSTTGLWSRTKIDSRLQELNDLNEGFCVFLIGVPSLPAVTQNEPRLVPGCLRSMGGRLQSLAGKKGELGIAGRWSEEIFAVVFDIALSEAPVSTEQVELAIGGGHVVQLDGSSHKVQLDVRVQAVDRPTDSTESAFYLRLGQAAFAVIAH